jgi:hypothetical protein
MCVCCIPIHKYTYINTDNEPSAPAPLDPTEFEDVEKQDITQEEVYSLFFFFFFFFCFFLDRRTSLIFKYDVMMI